jgi:glycosyltransferase involved in cell wall biosynthesis
MAGSKRIRLFAEYLACSHVVKAIVVGKNNGKNDNAGIFNKVPYEFVKFNFLQLCLSYYRVYKLLKKEFDPSKKNIIFLYNGIGLNNYIFLFIGKRLQFKIITDIVEDYSLNKENQSLERELLLKINNYFDHYISRFTDGIIVISTTLLKKYIDKGISQNKLLIIPVSAENLFLNLHKDKNSSQPLTFAYSGTYGKRDGVELLIKAFKLLLETNHNVCLQLAGKINEKIKNIISGVPQINYLGLLPDDEYYQFLQNADVLLMTRINSPYANAGFPFKLGEYLATGNTVITTDVSDLMYYLENKQDVIFAKPSDINSLHETMEYTISNRTEINEIGRNGYEKCFIHFNPLVNGSKLENFILSKI